MGDCPLARLIQKADFRQLENKRGQEIRDQEFRDLHPRWTFRKWSPSTPKGVGLLVHPRRSGDDLPGLLRLNVISFSANILFESFRSMFGILPGFLPDPECGGGGYNPHLALAFTQPTANLFIISLFVDTPPEVRSVTQVIWHMTTSPPRKMVRGLLGNIQGVRVRPKLARRGGALG